MARQASITVENNFTKGLITEVTGVNSPENSVSESQNVVYDRRGKAMKRTGVDYEFDHVFNFIDDSSVKARQEFVWDTAQTGSFLVLQTGRVIHFFSNSDVFSLSRSRKSFSLDLAAYSSGATAEAVGASRASFSSGKDYLFIAHPLCDTIYVRYNLLTDSISSDRVIIKIRDFEGVQDGLLPGERPGSLTNEHIYNLMNQGWWYNEFYYGDFYSNVLARAQFNGTWPSNSDIPWLWRQFSTATERDEFDPKFRDNTVVGNSTSPKGHYILDAFYMQRNGLVGEGAGGMTTTGLQVTTSGWSRPSCIAFFMGRVFFSGVDAEGYRSSVYFSQVIERDEQIGNCYQSNDPTSEHVSDLVASDGGVIKILDIGKIIDIRTFGQTLFVFAENGVWSVSGTQTSPFSATDYTVTKVSSFGAISETSIVELGDTPIWWNNEGIYGLGKSEVSLESSITNLSESTIQTFFEKIPVDCRRYAKGVFNDQTNVVYWVYSSRKIPDPYDYDSVLVFDTQTSAFFPLTLGVSNHKISGVVSVRGTAKSTIFSPVTMTTGEGVTSSDGVVTVEDGFEVEVSDKVFRFVTSRRIDSALTFSTMESDTYSDFPSSGFPESYNSEFVTGYRVRGDILKKFQNNYLSVVAEFDGLGGESCFVQGLWDYKNNNESYRYTSFQQIYRPKPYSDYQRSKIKIRGSGHSLQFKFVGEEGKNFVIIGWATFETGNSSP